MQRKTSPTQERMIPKTRRDKTAASPSTHADVRQIRESGVTRSDAAPVMEAPTLELADELPTDRTLTTTDLGPEPSASAKGSAPTPSKLDRLINLLRCPEGATIPEMCAATGWQAHSVRGALAGSLKRKRHAIISDKRDGTRHYRIEAAS